MTVSQAVNEGTKADSLHLAGEYPPLSFHVKLREKLLGKPVD
jgi:hypothetical protein